MPWLIAYYQPVGLFSLKHGEATSTGGKSLLIPTPFSIRTALVDAALRIEGIQRAEEIVENVRRLPLAIKPPKYVAVSALFAKVLKPERSDADSDRPFQKTIAFREYVHWWGTLGVALQADEPILHQATSWLEHITYFGKRGSLVQLEASPSLQDDLPHGFVALLGYDLSQEMPASFPLGLLQRLDEWGNDLTWERLNVYNHAGKIRVGKERIRFDVILPYQMTQAGRGFTVYENMGTK
ncbi:MAG: hypothetical protein D6802_01570 [Ardenticatenia bacterium]|nr:MAG: hypothetical protein D6802_01570 [Ardenticatenia bacterium]